MMICKFRPLIFSLFLVIVPVVPCSGAMITGGSATWTLNEGVAASIFDFDAYFDETATRAYTLSAGAPGNKPFETLARDNQRSPVVEHSGQSVRFESTNAPHQVQSRSWHTQLVADGTHKSLFDRPMSGRCGTPTR